MDIIKRLLVGLDLTPMDDSELHYAAFLCSQSAVEKVYFVHVEKSLELPDELMGAGLTKEQSVKDAIFKSLEERIQKYFGPVPKVEKVISVVEGEPVKEILKLAKREDIDLLLVGRKMELKGSGVLPQKLLRASRMSVLFVPENSEAIMRKIVVSIDFNEYSMMALDRILHSALTRPEIEIQCLHIYEVPPGYITLGTSYEEFDLRMQANANKRFEDVLERFPELRTRAALKLVKRQHDDDMGEIVVLEAKRLRADLLVIGAAGKSAAALFMLGSVTEKILDSDNDIPLLVFKRKDEKIGFLDALLREE